MSTSLLTLTFALTQEPDPLLLASPLVDFRPANIARSEEVHAAFKSLSDKHASLVVYHVASAIRFWERHAYLRNLSQLINVDGTHNVIEATKAAASFSSKQLIYISTAAVSVHQPRFFSMSRAVTPILRDDISINPTLLNQNHYNRTKREAEGLVREANGEQLRTAILRP